MGPGYKFSTHQRPILRVLLSGKNFSPIARYIVDVFRKHGQWGPQVVEDFNWLQQVTPKLVAKDLKIPNIDPRLSSKFFHWAELAMIYPNSFRIMVKTDNRIMLAWEIFKVLKLNYSSISAASKLVFSWRHYTHYWEGG